MGWFGWGETAPARPESAAAAAIEQQIEMMDTVFMKAVDHCSRNCIPTSYKEGELNKGESVCVKRCVDKFFTTLEIVGQQLAEIGAQATGQPLTPPK